VERVVFIQQGQVCASAPEELFEHFTEADPYLSKSLAEQLPCSRVDLRNHIEQFATRIGKVIILRFEKAVSLFQFVVLMNGIQVHGAHVIELCPKVANQLIEIGVREVDRVLQTRW